MSSRLLRWIGDLALVAAALAAYHFALGAGTSRNPAPAGEEVQELESLRNEVDRLASDVAARGSGGLSSALEEHIAALERRLQALGGAGTQSPARPGGGPAAAGEVTWTEGDLQSVRQMLDEIAARKVRNREQSALREQLKAADPSLEEHQIRAAIPLIYAYNEALKALWHEAFAGGATTPRKEVLDRATEAKNRLERDLLAVLPPTAMEKLRPSLSDLPRETEPPPEPPGQPPRILVK